jgi:hypothetical protein
MSKHNRKHTQPDEVATNVPKDDTSETMKVAETVVAAPQELQAAAKTIRDCWEERAKRDTALAESLINYANMTRKLNVRINQKALSEYVGCSTAHISQVLSPYNYGRDKQGKSHDALLSEVKAKGLNKFRAAHKAAPKQKEPPKPKAADVVDSLAFAEKLLPVMIPLFNDEHYR